MPSLNIIAIIPARYASERLHAKPLVDLSGKPMIQHVFERASRAETLNGVFVATDHASIAEAVRAFGGEAVMTPAAIPTGSDRVAYAATQLPDADIIVNVQGDEPLIDPRMIDEAVRPLILDPTISVGTLVKRITTPDDLTNPNVVKAVLDRDGFAFYFSRSPVPYLRNGAGIAEWHLLYPYYKHIGLYAYRKEFLMKYASWQESALERVEKLEQLRIIEHGYKIKAAVTEFDCMPVDTSEDAERVRRRMHDQLQRNMP